MLAFVVMGFLGSFFVLLGFVVWRFKIARIIAGYDPTKVKEPEKLAEWMGKCIMLTGSAAWIIGMVSFMFSNKNSDVIAFVSFMFVSMITAIISVVGAQRYYK